MGAGLSKWFPGVLLFSLLPLGGAVQNDAAVVHHVAGRRPVQGPNREMAADRPAETASQAVRPGERNGISTSASTSPWQLQATLPGAVIHDLSFPTPMVGFAAAELGQVWKTSDGGATWTEIMNLGFPYYWYGVHAFNANDVIVSGFHDLNGTGIIRWSHDGGTTWSGVIIISPANWSLRTRFANSTQGLVSDIREAVTHYTSDGGATAADWTQVTAQGSNGWFGNEFSLLPNLQVNAAGIDYCASADGGVNWNCQPSIDSIFDGAVFFANNNTGWVGGGEIAPGVEGWIHRTTDGGKTWSGRVLDDPWPIREIFFVSPTMGWAAGGNLYTSVGGIYFSADGGQTWSLDLDSLGNEMDACDSQPVGDGYRVWCAGFSSGFSGVVYVVQGASTPAFAPAPQTYPGSQSVSLSASTPGAAIYYTTDGSTPTTSSTAYTGPIAVASTVVLQAIALAPGTAPSLVAAGLYTITPQIQFTGGNSSVTVTAGNSATVQLTVGASANATSVTFSCSGLPAGAQCSFSPASVNATPQPTTVTLTISTSPSAVVHRSTGLPWVLAMILPGLLLLAGNANRVRRRNLVVGLLLALTLSLAGCGSSNSATPMQPRQVIQAAVTVTAKATGATPGTTQIQLTINP